MTALETALEVLAEIDAGRPDAERILRLAHAVVAMTPVVDAADDMVRVKREAEKVFNTGLSDMHRLTRTSPIAAGLAKATAKAGRKLERIVDEYHANLGAAL